MNEYENKKIIVVEDSAFARLMVCGKLKKLGYKNIAMPETSVEAWELIAQAQLSDFPYDLVITDLNMPDLDGMELIEKIKSDPLSESLKVLVISADADQIIINVTLGLGALGYLTKPVEKSDLEEMLLKAFAQDSEEAA
jgi:two-component system chemotaxis response regulator CheY